MPLPQPMLSFTQVIGSTLDVAGVGLNRTGTEEPMGLGRLYNARSRPLPARRQTACALLQLVELLRPSRRSQPSPRGDHQPAAVPDGDRPTRTRHARQTTIRVTSSHAKTEPAAQALAAVAAFLRGLAKNAEQLTRLQTWRAILSRAFQAFLNGRPRLAPT